MENNGPERSEMPESDTLPLVVPEREQQVTRSPEEAEEQLPLDEDSLIAEAIKPAIAFEHATRAAENDEALEKEHERRHEVKDVPTAQPVVHIGHILSGMLARQPSLAKKMSSKQTKVKEVPSKKKTKYDGMQTFTIHRSLYTKAILIGFSLGILAVLLFIILKVT